MHKQILYSLFLAAWAGTLLLGSCRLVGNDDQEKETEADSTYLRATLNGEEEWTAEGTRKTNFLTDAGGFEWLTLHVAYYPGPTTRYSYREKLVFIVIYRGTGTYSLLQTDHDGQQTGVSYYESEGDVPISSYHAIGDTSANKLTITSYDSTTGIMEGTFRTTVVVDSSERVPEPGEPPRRRPDTLRFTDGEFRQKVGVQ